MIGLVLVTHGRLAEELRSAMEHVVGPQRHVATVCIGPDDDVEGRRAEVCRCVADVDSGDGVVLLTDMFGGTPSNLAISQMDRPGVEVLAGVNLPMLVKLAKVRGDRPLADAVDCAQTAGRKYIACASTVLPPPKPRPTLVTAAPILPAANGTLANGTLAGGTLANGTLANGTLANGTLATGTMANGVPAGGSLANGAIACEDATPGPRNGLCG